MALILSISDKYLQAEFPFDYIQDAFRNFSVPKRIILINKSKIVFKKIKTDMINVFGVTPCGINYSLKRVRLA